MKVLYSVIFSGFSFRVSVLYLFNQTELGMSHVIIVFGKEKNELWTIFHSIQEKSEHHRIFIGILRCFTTLYLLKPHLIK